MRSNDPETDSGDGRTRRSVLRNVGATAVGGIAAGSVLAGEATASEGRCPEPHGYWADAEWPDTLEDPFELGGRERSIEEWKAFLRADPGEDKAHMLAKRLLATIVNFHYRWPTDPGCTDQPLDELNGRTVTDVKGRAYDWLNWSRFGDGRPQPYWLVHYRWHYLDGQPIMAALERFNRGEYDGLDCDCVDATTDRAKPSEARAKPAESRAEPSESAATGAERSGSDRRSTGYRPWHRS